MLQKQIRVCKEITAQASFRAQLNQLSLLLSYKAIKCFRAGVVPAQQDPRGVLGSFTPKFPWGSGAAASPNTINWVLLTQTHTGNRILNI